MDRIGIGKNIFGLRSSTVHACVKRGINESKVLSMSRRKMVTTAGYLITLVVYENKVYSYLPWNGRRGTMSPCFPYNGGRGDEVITKANGVVHLLTN